MNLEFFVKTTNLNDLIIENVEYRNNSIYLKVSMNIEIEYIANGCRPEFNKTVKHIFIFPNQEEVENKKETQYVLDTYYNQNELILKLTTQILKIKNCEIEIIQNVE